jgi:pimeloyl-ACP methyl ester carboxylesterase
MRRWMAAPLLFGSVFALSASLDTCQVQAQAKAEAPVEETFLTADGIQLHGLFHRSTKSPGNDPVVILIYPPGKDNNMLKGDWLGLANRLSEAGFNVFRFDWRGHGKSNDIKDAQKFWQNPFTGPWNQRYISGANKKPIKDTFFFKDFVNNTDAPIKYMPAYLTDLAAARVHLDNKNDVGDVNTSSVYVIGSEAAATIGIGWIATEWNRPAIAPSPNQLMPIDPKYAYVPQPLRDRDFETAGNDISAAVWLSASRPSSFSPQVVKGFISGILPNGRMMLAPKTRDNNPMLFMYAAGDKKGETESKFFHLEVLVGKGDKPNGLNKLNDNYLLPLQNAGALTGVNLLGDDEKRGTEGKLMKFLEEIQKTRKSIVRKNRGFSSPYFIKLDNFGLLPAQ